MSYFNFYKKSHSPENIDGIITIPMMAKAIASQNYGTHRMVCALVEEHEKKYPDSELVAALRKVVECYTT